MTFMTCLNKQVNNNVLTKPKNSNMQATETSVDNYNSITRQLFTNRPNKSAVNW